MGDLLSGVKLYSKSAVVQGGSPVALLPTIKTTESGLAPPLLWLAIGLKLPMASTTTWHPSETCKHPRQIEDVNGDPHCPIREQ